MDLYSFMLSRILLYNIIMHFFTTSVHLFFFRCSADIPTNVLKFHECCQTWVQSHSDHFTMSISLQWQTQAGYRCWLKGGLPVFPVWTDFISWTQKQSELQYQLKKYSVSTHHSPLYLPVHGVKMRLWLQHYAVWISQCDWSLYKLLG